jgi:hypothetical protein
VGLAYSLLFSLAHAFRVNFVCSLALCMCLGGVCEFCALLHFLSLGWAYHVHTHLAWSIHVT